MAKSLIVVESPTKVKTIKKFLGSDYDVVASMGHIKDLPKSTLGIDLANNFEPTYSAIEAKKKTIDDLKKAALDYHALPKPCIHWQRNSIQQSY